MMGIEDGISCRSDRKLLTSLALKMANKEYPTAGEAYKAIRAIADSEFPKQPIFADWFECQVVDEFGVPIAEPT
jgi:hypothetical protein